MVLRSLACGQRMARALAEECKGTLTSACFHSGTLPHSRTAAQSARPHLMGRSPATREAGKLRARTHWRRPTFGRVY